MSDTPKDAKGIFLAALDIQDPAERSAFVERSCGGDEALRQRVEHLLCAYGEPDGPLDKLAAALAPTQLGEPIREQVGATIGPYKLMEQIGEGGFGLVFVAEQQQPIRRKVAIKIIKPGMDMPDVIARFEAERQALALMDHPNIAKVLDAGTTDSGRPYFVMELVRGIPITDYCDQTQLTPRERLELFVPVCNAIQHAHLKGIIHRDIKPSNVLVTLHDDRPVVKVIDFGVAKALHQHLTEKTVYTRFAQMIGTPLYMSPEQAQMSGLDIDTRTDVYSLGVLLYELLTGTTPFNKERLAKAAYDELLKIIREEEPPKPSVRLSQSTDSLPSIAAQRRTEPGKLSKMFNGDLDWIAMKALEKDRTRRYETANAFSADVLRYLNDEPVEASPPSAGYRLRKFARKHRKPVIALAVIVAVLVLGIAGTTWGLFRAWQAEQAADASKREAIDALKEVTQERDAKEMALIAEAAERDRAERQFANGLLRPIGFNGSPDAGLLHCFVDWSATRDSRLKLRVLQIAFENPETALRVARQAEYVIQACVGLSPTRRSQAVKLVSAKQRDSGADARIRVAACWLALELGSSDLPAWGEACRYLADAKNKSASDFNWFVGAAAASGDSQQISQLDLDPLFAVLAKPADSDVEWTSQISAGNGPQFGAGRAIATLAPRLDSTRINHAADALISILELPSGTRIIRPAVLEAIAAFAPRMEPSQIARAWDAVIGSLPQPEQQWGVNDPRGDALVALAPRLEPAKVGPAGDALMPILRKPWPNPQATRAAANGLEALAPRLSPEQAKRAGDAAVTLVQALLGEYVYDDPSALLVALSPRMEPAQLKRAWDALLAAESSESDSARYAAAAAMPAIAQRLGPREVEHNWDADFTGGTDPPGPIFYKSIVGWRILSPLLGPVETERRLSRIVGRPDLADQSADISKLVALAPCLKAAEAKRAWDWLITIGRRPRDEGPARLAPVAGRLYKKRLWYPPTVADAMIAVVPRLEPAEVPRVANTLIVVAEATDDDAYRYAACEGLAALGPRLSDIETNRADHTFLSLLQHSKDDSTTFLAVRGLSVLAPRMNAVDAKDARDALVMGFERSAYLDLCQRAALGMAALSRRSNSESQDNLAARASLAMLDIRISDAPRLIFDLRSNRIWDANEVALASALSLPRAVAKLLSHPACVGKEREHLLQRFEELVFYQGRPVFLKPQPADGTAAPPKDESPPRRFHNLSDAAAWIQQNWPDFDLETNCPVTWRGSR